MMWLLCFILLDRIDYGFAMKLIETSGGLCFYLFPANLEILNRNSTPYKSMVIRSRTRIIIWLFNRPHKQRQHIE